MASDGQDTPDVSLIQQECTLYRRLLELSEQTSPASLLEESLTLLVELTRATEGYLELYDDHDQGDGPRWSVAGACLPSACARSRARSRVASSRPRSRPVTRSSRRTPCSTSASANARAYDAGASRRSCARRSALALPAACSISSAEPVSSGSRRSTASASSSPASTSPRSSTAYWSSSGGWTPRIRRSRTVPGSDSTGCVGRSQALADVLDEVAIAARSDRNALILGETGSGKTQIARIIHDNSARRGQPFRSFNMHAVQDTLVEAELFGHERGSFTGAVGQRKGLIAQAEHGTLFLDEIGDMSPKMQAALLTFLETKEYMPIGGSPVRADVRVITGTFVDLERAMAEGRFRRDLLYRLDVISFRMPSLVERREDIVELATFFRDEASRVESCRPLPFSPAAIRALEAHKWDGNVRELQNAVQRAVSTLKDGRSAQIEPAHLFNRGRKRQDEPEGPETLQEATQRFQKGFIEDVLRQTQGNVNQAAKQIDISRSYLYQLMSEFSIARPARA